MGIDLREGVDRSHVVPVVGPFPEEERRRRDLKSIEELHRRLLVILEEEGILPILKLLDGRGWTLRDTEGACCELRKFRKAAEALAAGGRPKRERDLATVDYRAQVRAARLALLWQTLGGLARIPPGADGGFYAAEESRLELALERLRSKRWKLQNTAS